MEQIIKIVLDNWDYKFVGGVYGKSNCYSKSKRRGREDYYFN